MRRIQKAMIGIFLGGIFLGGIGTGIALVEYSSLSYGGECLMGEEYLVTKNLDFPFQQDGKILIIEAYDYGDSGRPKLEEDDTVPEGTVRYEVTYNEKSVALRLRFDQFEEDDQRTEGEGQEYLGRLWLSSAGGIDGFQLFMENKDRFLEDLKQKKISSYKEAWITAVKIKVNPKTRPYIEYGNEWY